MQRILTVVFSVFNRQFNNSMDCTPLQYECSQWLCAWSTVDWNSSWNEASSVSCNCHICRRESHFPPSGLDVHAERHRRPIETRVQRTHLHSKRRYNWCRGPSQGAISPAGPPLHRHANSRTGNEKCSAFCLHKLRQRDFCKRGQISLSNKKKICISLLYFRLPTHARFQTDYVLLMSRFDFHSGELSYLN
jgi:hypothetical protein